MPNQFQCPACQASIQTADGTAGKPARCPRCGTVVVVPGVSGAPRPDAPSTAVTSSLPAASEFSEGTSKPAQPPSAGPLNPYATPQNIFAEGPFSSAPGPSAVDVARGRLIGPAIGMILFALAGLGFMALVAVVFAVDPNRIFKEVGPDPAERVGAYGFLIAYFTLGLLSRCVQLAGAIAMLRVRGYSLAMAGAISAMIPCEIYCCLPCLPFGIWGLVMLLSWDVKRAFR